MRVIVTGSRTWTDEKAIEDALRTLPTGTVVVHGAHWEGADVMAERAAMRLGLQTEPHPADWRGLGRRAGPARNGEMALLGADLCLAFRSAGESRGTDDMVRKARSRGIPVKVFGPSGQEAIY